MRLTKNESQITLNSQFKKKKSKCALIFVEITTKKMSNHLEMFSQN